MKNTVLINFESYDSLAELSVEDLALVQAAKAASENAYAPYSEFKVGAAARLSSGEVVCSSNQEYAAYPSGMCAERGLFYFLGANYSDSKVVSVAIYSPSSSGECYPCGACREVMADYQARQGAAIRVIMAGDDSATMVNSAEDLLPFKFKLK